MRIEDEDNDDDEEEDDNDYDDDDTAGAETNQVTTWHIPASKRGAAPPQTLLHRSPQNFQQYFSLYQQVFSRKNLTVFRNRNSLFSSS